MHSVRNRWYKENTVKVEWNIGKRCNYDCSYCPAEIHDNHSKSTPIDELISAADQLLQINKHMRISFTGGEPCVNKGLPQLIEYIKLNGVSFVSVTTNGTMPADYYACQRVDQYVFSVHFEYDTERVLETILSINDLNKFQIVVHVMVLEEQIERVHSVVDTLDVAGIPYVLRRIRWNSGLSRDDFDDSRYETKTIQWMVNSAATVKPNCIVDDTTLIHANDVLKTNTNQFQGWSCNAGIESLMIDQDGEVYRATCRVGGTLGNIYNEKFTIPNEWITCTRKFCTCESDIPLTKCK